MNNINKNNTYYFKFTTGFFGNPTISFYKKINLGKLKIKIAEYLETDEINIYNILVKYNFKTDIINIYDDLIKNNTKNYNFK